DFRYIIMHELTHYIRRVMFFKWLVQIKVCLHWFNPLVFLMSREITKACEFSCDEAVLAAMGGENAEDYGKTLLDAMAAVGKYKENLGSVTLSENKQLLKERLGAIMNFKKKSTAIRLLTGALTLCVMFGAAFVGVYPAAAAKSPGSRSYDNFVYPKETGINRESDFSQIERYYKAGSLPLFQIAFPRLDKEEQLAWLEKIYADEDITFFSVAVRGLDTNSSVLISFSEKVYEDADIAFFSTLADCMGETELELWLDRALEDGNWAFQSMLFDKLNKKDEFDEMGAKREKELAEVQMAEYEKAGITMVDEKTYYYRGQLVNIFMDIRKEGSVYTLNMNPAGTVNIKITRDANNNITGAAYMTEAEVTTILFYEQRS
ncbi:MAG: M56 family metallopeptidase, partial [Oscillospiraceae bacterium]|nr:M56 family metallopeptidase [Oscillospiraceae bacterium]